MTYKKILHIALPAMGEQLLHMLMGTIDNYLVAQLGVLAVSAVSVANNLMSVYQAVFIALATAASSLVASKSKTTDNHQLLAETLAITVIIGMTFGALSLFFGETLLSGLGLTGQVLHLSRVYLAVVGGSAILLGLMTSLSGLLRAKGQPRRPLLISLVTNGLNLVLSALFLAVTDWGVVGVAAGTVLARAVGVGLLWRSLPHRPVLRQLLPSNYRQLLPLMLPLVGERLMMRAGDVVLVAIVVRLGTVAVAGQAIGETLIQFSYLPALGLAVATVILVAQYRDNHQVQHRLVHQAYMLAIAFMTITSLLVWGFGDIWLSAFTTDRQVMTAAGIVLLVAALEFPVTAGTQVLTATWQGLGQPRYPFYATSIGIWLVRVLGGYLLAIRLGLGLWGICLAITLDNLWRTSFLYWFYRRWLTSSSNDS